MSRRVGLTTVLLLIGAAAPGAAQEPPIPAPTVALAALDLQLNVDYAEGTLAGTARLTLRNEATAPIERVPLQVHRLMRFGAARLADGTAVDLEQDVLTYVDSPRRQVTQAWVALPRALAPGDSVGLVVDWSGFLWGYTETGTLYVRDHVDEAFTIIREDAAAFPTPRVLSWQANRQAPRVDFRFRASVTVPDTQVVAMGGERVKRTARDGRASYVFNSAEPVPFLNIVIAPYHLLERAGLRVYHFAEDSAGAAVLTDAVAAAADTLTRWFGPLGRPMSLTVMEIPQGFGSQASLSAGIIIDAAAFRERDQLRQLYHELTHLWNAPDNDQPPVRWNEGLASFLEMRLANALDGGSGLDDYLPRYLAWFLPRYEADPENREVPFIDYGRTGRTDLSYGVGFLMFYALHRLLGPDAFDDAVGGWYQERRRTGGTTLEFVEFVERRAALDLRPFFQEWMFSTSWYDRLKAGESMDDLIESYVTAAGIRN